MAGDGLTVPARPGADPIEAHVRALRDALHGPRRVRASLLAEARDGLEDAAQALCDDGVDAAEARSRAVAEFGPVREVADGYQDELAAAQCRRTATLMAVAFPALLLSWNLLWSAVSGPAAPSTPTFSFLSRLEDATSLVAGLVALAALVALRRGSPRRVLFAVTALGVLTPVVCVGAALGMAVLGPHGGDAHVAGYVVTAAVLVALVRSVARAHRMLAHTRPL
ncbi:hypothetical protein PSU4_55370 [Pseudonocardia sulfidoxydans NBRC 16205]|uniref:Uncharacterized protein n=1 Tax=Pseudonocardia sulfidoxydans NBRC 16205 TaxID=1223511 RepID=A0A511DQS3_9PSEU|nr:permease prefix domain 1-containing protein [Pseudonocardia sulfidoxydans]GEL26583.1 hypothetical protein PSU4_55370 [Pseudonocardia sulfidoxydans NBRC 16205]